MPLFNSAKEKLNTKLISLLTPLILLGLLVAQPTMYVSAHQSPGGCNSNRFNVSIVKDKTEISQGDTLTYSVTASNVNSGSDIACDLTAASIQVTLPAADGTPTGTVVVLTPNMDFPAGTTTALIGAVPYVVNVNPGVLDVVAEVRAEGTLHDAPVDHAALIVKTLGTTIIVPPTSPPGSGSGSSSNIRIPGLPNTGTAKKQ